MLEKNNMLSMNQTQAQIKLMEMWKSKNVETYPIKPTTNTYKVNAITTRSATLEQFKLNTTPSTFVGDATRLWNTAPVALKSAASLNIAKKITKSYCKTLPI